MVFSGPCSACGAHSDSLRRCQGLCGGASAAASYCSKACQSRHWKSGHKRICGKVPKGFAMTAQAESGRAVLRCTDDDKNMHPFCNVGGIFLKELAKYLEGNPELVEIEYNANIKEVGAAGGDGDDDDDKDDESGNGKNFERNCNLPKAAVARAKVDSDFDYALAHSVALAYDDELLAAARSNNVKCDCGNDEPVAKIFHSPVTKARPDRYALVDMFARPCCSNDECLRKTKGDFTNFQRDLVQFVRERGLPP